jgi:hypothetical protein
MTIRRSGNSAKKVHEKHSHGGFQNHLIVSSIFRSRSENSGDSQKSRDLNPRFIQCSETSRTWSLGSLGFDRGESRHSSFDIDQLHHFGGDFTEGVLISGVSSSFGEEFDSLLSSSALRLKRAWRTHKFILYQLEKSVHWVDASTIMRQGTVHFYLVTSMRRRTYKAKVYSRPYGHRPAWTMGLKLTPGLICFCRVLFAQSELRLRRHGFTSAAEREFNRTTFPQTGPLRFGARPINVPH